MKIFGQTVIRLPKEPTSPPKESDATWRAKFYERSLSPEFTANNSLDASSVNNVRYDYSSEEDSSDDDDEYASDSNMSHSDTDTSAANSESEEEENQKN
ncbi:unnamed protein product [Caenorhabditis nigoni]